MMIIEAKILNILIDKYEKSGHCLPEKSSNRGVILVLGSKDYPDYKTNSYNIVTEVNSAIQILENKKYVTAKWRRGLEGKLYEKVYLNLPNIDQIYCFLNRQPLVMGAQSVREILLQAFDSIQ